MVEKAMFTAEYNNIHNSGKVISFMLQRSITLRLTFPNISRQPKI